MTRSARVLATVAIATLMALPVAQLGGRPAAAATGAGTFTPTACTTSLYQPITVFADGQPIVNDCPVTIRWNSDIAKRRQALINFVWGATGFPSTKLPASVDRNVSSPVAGLTNLARVDTLHIAMELGQETVAHHFIPLAGAHNRLVILQQGHNCTLNDDPAPDVGNGMQRTINALLGDGYSVLAFYMPHINDQLPNDCAPIQHDDMFRMFHPTGSVLKYFLEPIAVGLNYVQNRAAADGFPTYSNFSMIGLSGGGWTTVVYAAIDPRIALSVPVAGSLPLYLRFPADEGDTEQNLAPFYRLAGYEDLHVMGTSGGRRQVQVLNRHDDCCFGEAFHRSDLTGMTFDQATRSYEWRVRDTSARLGRGTFRFVMDESAPAHMISWNTISNVLLAELDGDRRTVAATAAGDVFVHGTNGHVWWHGPTGWQDTGLTTVGVPAAVASPGGGADVFFRDVDNHLVHATRSAGGSWTGTAMDGTVITDPVAASAGDGSVDVVAAGPDYRLSRWSVRGTTVERTSLGATQVLGQPAVVAAPGRVDVFFRGFDARLHHVRASAGGVVDEVTGPGGTGSPAAIRTTGTSGATLRVYRRRNARIWEGASTADGAWHWTRLEPVGTLDHFIGSPSVSSVGGRVVVAARTTRRTLGRFELGSATGWQYANVGGWTTDTPAVTGDVAYGRGRAGDLQQLTGQGWQSLGGAFS